MLVVGLGNPGSHYLFTRHNVGFMVIDLLSSSIGSIKKEIKKSWGVIQFITLNDREFVTLKPLTYMNSSGVAVAQFFKEGISDVDHFLVVHDDLDLPLGRIKIVRKGSAGGHRGVLSIMETMKTSDFPRIKVGIGRPLYGEDVVDYVLSPPYKEEEEIFRKVLEKATEAVKTVLIEGIDKAMNIFNGLVIS